MLSTLLALHLLAVSQSPQPPAPPPERAWYGWQTLIADGAAAAVLGTGIYVRVTTATGPPGNGIIGAGAAIYFMGAPTVHGVQGDIWRVLASVGVRFGATLVGMAVGGFVSIFTHGLFTGTASYVEPVTGALVGGAVASLYDAWSLAYRPVPAAASASAPQVRLAPYMGTVRGGPVAGVAGAF